MPYTKLGTFIAGVAFVLGCVQIAVGLTFATGSINDPRLLIFLAGSTSEQAIDSGLIKILAAVAFGVLTEISRSVERR